MSGLVFGIDKKFWAVLQVEFQTESEQYAKSRVTNFEFYLYAIQRRCLPGAVYSSSHTWRIQS